MDAKARAAHGTSRPWIGITAFLVAVLLAVVASMAYNNRAITIVSRSSQALAPLLLSIKTRDLTFQRAALADPRLLPIFGTSELYCCAGGFNGPRFFLHEPTGFALYAAGVPVTADLFFAETFAALGHALHGKRVVVSDSAWFTSALGVSPQAYNHTFSPEVAEVFAFASPIALPLREAIAHQMLAYPRGLVGHPLLRAALRDLARGTPASLAAYYLLDPVGRLAAWVSELRGDASALAYLRGHPSQAGPVADARQAPDWPALLRRARAVSAALTANNPFGILKVQWRQCGDIVPAGACASALTLLRRGATNESGSVYPYPSAWVRQTMTSAEWTDLRLELEVLRSLGARPFVYLIPMQGVYDNHTPLSLPARQVLYQHFAAVVGGQGVPFTTFSRYDGSRYFVDSFGHFNARGWVTVDYILNLFWHGRLGPRLRRQLAAGGIGIPPAAGSCPRGTGGGVGVGPGTTVCPPRVGGGTVAPAPA